MTNIDWVKATDIADRAPIWVNLSTIFGIKRIVSPSPGTLEHTRIWSGAISSFAIPGPGSTSQDYSTEDRAFFISVEETPEQLFMKAFGFLPGENE